MSILSPIAQTLMQRALAKTVAEQQIEEGQALAAWCRDHRPAETNPDCWNKIEQQAEVPVLRLRNAGLIGDALDIEAWLLVMRVMRVSGAMA